MKIPQYDIFFGQTDKDALWLEAVEGLGTAKDRMQALATQRREHTSCFASEGIRFWHRLIRRFRPSTSMRADRRSLRRKEWQASHSTSHNRAVPNKPNPPQCPFEVGEKIRVSNYGGKIVNDQTALLLP